jgi:hypothetical protein
MPEKALQAMRRSLALMALEEMQQSLDRRLDRRLRILSSGKIV